MRCLTWFRFVALLVMAATGSPQTGFCSIELGWFYLYVFMGNWSRLVCFVSECVVFVMICLRCVSVLWDSLGFVGIR